MDTVFSISMDVAVQYGQWPSIRRQLRFCSGLPSCDGASHRYTASMVVKRRRHEPEPEKAPEPTELLQVIATYQLDLMAEVEGLLRTLTKAQAQLERLRTGNDGDAMYQSQRREAIKLLSGNLKTFMAKVETLREALPEIMKTVESLEGTLPPES